MLAVCVLPPLLLLLLHPLLLFATAGAASSPVLQLSMCRWAPSCVVGWRSPSVSRTQWGRSLRQTQRATLQTMTALMMMHCWPHQGQEQQQRARRALARSSSSSSRVLVVCVAMTLTLSWALMMRGSSLRTRWVDG